MGPPRLCSARAVSNSPMFRELVPQTFFEEGGSPCPCFFLLLRAPLATTTRSCAGCATRRHCARAAGIPKLFRFFCARSRSSRTKSACAQSLSRKKILSELSRKLGGRLGFYHVKSMEKMGVGSGQTSTLTNLYKKTRCWTNEQFGGNI